MKRMSKRQEAPSVRMKLFVYGSLRMGLYNYELYLKGKSQFLGYGYVIGELYSLLNICTEDVMVLSLSVIAKKMTLSNIVKT